MINYIKSDLFYQSHAIYTKCFRHLIRICVWMKEWCCPDYIYMCSIDIYAGKKEVVTKDLGGGTFLDMVAGLENKEHILYMDLFY